MNKWCQKHMICGMQLNSAQREIYVFSLEKNRGLKINDLNFQHKSKKKKRQANHSKQNMK